MILIIFSWDGFIQVYEAVILGPFSEFLSLIGQPISTMR